MHKNITLIPNRIFNIYICEVGWAEKLVHLESLIIVIVLFLREISAALSIHVVRICFLPLKREISHFNGHKTNLQCAM